MHRIRTSFGDPRLFAVSSYSGEGVPALIQQISSIFVDAAGLPLAKAPPRLKLMKETQQNERLTGGKVP
jgi:hypothetical protein